MAKEFKSVKTTSFIAEGTELIGKLTIKGGIRIDGRVKGDIFSESVVFLGDSAKVDANIQAKAIISSGKIKGDISSAQQVQISNPGSINGSIETKELVLEKGVFFDGSCKIIEP
jgi:cytoskeletal protein CcmA (bactofilin family)